MPPNPAVKRGCRKNAAFPYFYVSRHSMPTVPESRAKYAT